MVLGRVRNLTSPGLSRHQSGEHDGIFASSKSRSCSLSLSTTPQIKCRRNEKKKRGKKKKNPVPGQMLGCQWLTRSYLSFNLSLLPSLSLLLSLSFSPSLYLSRFWFGTEEADGNCSELGRQLHSVPLTKGYKAQPFR